ncbi:DUF6289 family protein [Streptosporangium soli]|nr:DUF6289 family protein [Streptosporangium sp. KLBMP 9127]
MIRRVLAVVVLATAALATVPASAQAALPACRAGYMCNSQFFSDSARTRLVGVKTEHCNGEVVTWGRVTGYLNWSTSPCT